VRWLGAALVLAGCAHQAPLGRVREGTPDDVNIVKARQAGVHRAFEWHAWSAETFAKARAEKKPLLVDGAAEWCHWCHVMDETTYADAEVGRLLNERFIAVRVDIDARPDLAERYGDWGWPATIVLSPDAEELGKYRGYLETQRLLEILKSVGDAKPEAAEAPLPGIPVSELPRAVAHAKESFAFFRDPDEGGYGIRKVPIGLNVVWELSSGDRAHGLFTLKKQRALIDRVWGGIYQYSAARHWNEPHFEKLLTYQAPNLEALSLGYELSHDAALLDDARLLARYLTTFLSSDDGGFYVNQDADLNAHAKDKPFVDGHVFYALDDAGRRALGVPWVDTHVYAFENGLAISALVRFSRAAKEPEALARAVKAAQALSKGHVLPDGGVRHEASGKGAFFLSDAASVVIAFVRLSEATGDAQWKTKAEQIAERLWERFGGAPHGALFDSTVDPDAQGVFARRRASFGPNILGARALNAVGRVDQAKSVLASMGSTERLDGEMAWLGEFLLASEGK
jgi:uncharacterized protein YyaL (SSP411 family)